MMAPTFLGLLNPASARPGALCRGDLRCPVQRNCVSWGQMALLLTGFRAGRSQCQAQGSRESQRALRGQLLAGTAWPSSVSERGVARRAGFSPGHTRPRASYYGDMSLRCKNPEGAWLRAPVTGHSRPSPGAQCGVLWGLPSVSLVVERWS